MDTKELRLIIVSGVSGSGTSTALRALEDIGFFSVNNLPDSLLDAFVKDLLSQSSSMAASETSLYALLVDCRDQKAVQRIRRAMEEMTAAGISVELLFLDAQDEVLLTRFRQTRRPHPLIRRGSSIKTVAEALEKERMLLADLRDRATRIIDTSALSPHDLRRAVEQFAECEEVHLNISILTFGFKYGVPQDIDLLVDVRFLPNPHFVPELKDRTGLERDVRDYVFSDRDADEFVARYFSLLEFLIPRYEQEGKRYLTLAIGCTGGRHRSVALGARIAELFREQGKEVALRHRDKARG